jgi:choline dehydrogenase-like flavoprotein
MRATDAADFVVVGSGAAGASAALALAEAGRDVAVLEEGPEVRDADRGLGPHEALMRLFRDRGTQVSLGRSVIPVLQGRCVGGSTVVNGAIVWRLPEDAYERCFGGAGARDALPLAELERKMDRIERDLSIATTPDGTIGNNGLLMRAGSRRLGWRGHAIVRNVTDCQASGRCIEACPTRRKQSMEVTYLPRVRALGARVFADHEVRRIETRKGLASAVTGVRAGGASFRFEARRGVVLAASAIQTPTILARSGLGQREHVGAHLMSHPGTAVVGIYRDRVELWNGATQSYEVDEFRSAGFKMEVVGLPVELAGVRLPGLGVELSRNLADYGHMAVWAVQVRAEAEGSVTPTIGGARIGYTPAAQDMDRFREGVKRLCEMHFAAGAVRVHPGVHGGPAVLHSVDDLGKLDELSVDPRAYSLLVSHVFGTCRMARTADAGVVDFDGAVRGVRRLWIVDASVFPRNLGVNPQHTIMALALVLGERIGSKA